MNAPMVIALLLAGVLILLGGLTGAAQIRGLRQLAARSHVPSDEFAYLRGRHRRRLLTAAIMFLVGAMIAGSYLSGMEERADALGAKRIANAQQDGPKLPMTKEEKAFTWVYFLYWVTIIVLVFGLLGLALIDTWSSRRYWLTQFRNLREDHNAKLRRDLAVYRAQKTRHGRTGGRLGESES